MVRSDLRWTTCNSQSIDSRAPTPARSHGYLGILGSVQAPERSVDKARCNSYPDKRVACQRRKYSRAVPSIVSKLCASCAQNIVNY